MVEYLTEITRSTIERDYARLLRELLLEESGGSEEEQPASRPAGAHRVTCQRCGKPFEAKSLQARFCSPKCRTAASRARRKGDE